MVKSDKGPLYDEPKNRNNNTKNIQAAYGLEVNGKIRQMATV
jgi:hypothetical protein